MSQMLKHNNSWFVTDTYTVAKRMTYWQCHPIDVLWACEEIN